MADATRQKKYADFKAFIIEKIGNQDAIMQEVFSKLQSLTSMCDKLSVQYAQVSTNVGNHSMPRDHSQTVEPSSSSIKSADNNFVRRLKLHFLNCNGVNPYVWIYRAEQYFEYQNIAEEQQVQLAYFHLEGAALQWYRWMTKTKGPVTWTEFSSALLKRIGPTEFDDAAEALSQLRQQTSVIAYQEEFEKLSHLVDDLPEPFLVGSFVGGLKDEIRLEVKMQRPRSLSTAIGLARLVEEKYKLRKKNFMPCSLSPSSPKKGTSSTRLLGQSNATPPSTFKHLTPSEVKDRLECGLCYYCDDKFAPEHRCLTPYLFMIEASHEDDEVLDEESQKALENVASD